MAEAADILDDVKVGHRYRHVVKHRVEMPLEFLGVGRTSADWLRENVLNRERYELEVNRRLRESGSSVRVRVDSIRLVGPAKNRLDLGREVSLMDFSSEVTVTAVANGLGTVTLILVGVLIGGLLVKVAIDHRRETTVFNDLGVGLGVVFKDFVGGVGSAFGGWLPVVLVGVGGALFLAWRRR